MWWKLDSRLIKMSHSEPPHWIKLESRGQEWCFVSLPETTYSLVPVNMILCLSVCACLCICVYVYTAAWNQERVVMFSEDVCSFTQRGKTKQQTTATTSLNRGNDLNSSTPLLSHSLSLLSIWRWLVVVLYAAALCVCSDLVKTSCRLGNAKRLYTHMRWQTSMH